MTYHEQGTLPDRGMPARSLYTSAKLLSMRHHIDITDDEGNIIYYSKSKILSFVDKTYIYDQNDREVSCIIRRIFSFTQRHTITMSDGLTFDMASELFHLLVTVINVPELNWQLRGDIFKLNFEIIDDSGEVVASIGQKFVSLHDKYSIDIYKPEYEEIVIAILITLEHMLCDRIIIIIIIIIQAHPEETNNHDIWETEDRT